MPEATRDEPGSGTVARRESLSLAFGKQEPGVEAGVVGGQHVVADEIQQLRNHLRHRWGAVDHSLRDARQRGYERRDAYAAINQRHVPLGHRAIDDA
ncbi:hypothetical protein HDE77_002814 [Rhodanobacter sp. MP7CTX1]|nr:hypothetical protein [Rhodanobacter sp. MP7CTX1]